MNATKLWLSVKETAPLLGKSPKNIYDQIRLGSFPFAYRRGRGDSGAIYISARDIGLITDTQTKEAQNSATIEARNTACAFGD